MKKQYQKPLTVTALLQSEPLMALSAKGHTLTFDNPDTDADAGNAAARTFSVWDDDEDSERDEDEV